MNPFLSPSSWCDVYITYFFTLDSDLCSQSLLHSVNISYSINISDLYTYSWVPTHWVAISVFVISSGIVTAKVTLLTWQQGVDPRIHLCCTYFKNMVITLLWKFFVVWSNIHSLCILCMLYVSCIVLSILISELWLSLLGYWLSRLKYI